MVIERVAEAASRARRVSTLLQFIRERQRTFVIGSTITIVLNGLSILVSGVASILVARALGPQQLGYLVLFTTGTATIALFADAAGIFYSNAYIVASGNHKFNPSTITGTVLGYGFVVGLVTGSVFGLVSSVRLVIFRGFDEPIWGVLIGLKVLGLTLLSQIRGLFLGRSNFLILGALGLFQAAFYAILALGAAYPLAWRTGLQIAVMQLVATWMCVVGASVFLTYQGITYPSLGYLKACARVGWRAAVINWLSFLHTRVDHYLVSILLGPLALGLYGVAVSLGELLTRIPGMLGMVLFSIVASDQGRLGAARSTLKRTSIVMAIVGIACLFLAFFTPVVVGVLYGHEFYGAVTALRLLLPAIVFLSGLLLINQHLAGWGYPPILIVSTVVGLGGNILFNLWLLPRVGIVGASIASSVTYGAQILIVLGYLVRLLRRGEQG